MCRFVGPPRRPPPARGAEQARPTCASPAVRLSGRPRPRGAEVAREVEDAADLGAPEGVDRLVGVADDDEVAAVAGESLEQADLARVGVLVLVDEDPGSTGVAAARARPGVSARATARWTSSG